MPSASIAQTRSHLALISMLITLALFGAFWFWQERKTQKETQEAINALPQAPAQTTTAASFAALESSAVNIAIPSFESTL